jgi:hypothetical protein
LLFRYLFQVLFIYLLLKSLFQTVSSLIEVGFREFVHLEMAFFWGDEVEVCSKLDGFVGSHYAGTVVAEYRHKTYAVRYKTLVTEDECRPLVEVVGEDEMRPEPPKVLASGFALFEEVDAFDNDGWWVGKITGRKGSNYYVWFDKYGEEIAYPFSQLRAHLEWVGGKWVSSKKRVF